MQRRRLLRHGSAGIVAATLAGCVGAQANGEADSSQSDDSEITVEQTDPNTITVEGTGTISTDPNKAELSVAIEATDSDDADAVVAELARRSEQLIEDLTAAGIEEAAITTTRYSLRHNSRENQYEGQHRYQVEIEDHTRAGEIIDVAAGSTADSIRRVRFTITESRRDELYDEAVQDAVENARDEAVRYTQAADLVLEEPLEIETTQTQVSPIERRGHVALEAADDAPTELEEGNVSVSASVTITYTFTAESE